VNDVPDAHRLDKRRVRRAFGRAAAGYDRAAVLQARVGENALSRLDLIRCVPARVLDLGCGTGEGARALARRYRGAQVLGADLAPAMLRRARRRFEWRGPRYLAADAEALPFAGASFDLVYSNLMLQWLGGLETAFAECARVLRPGGLLLLTTFGPDTLIELRGAFAQVDRGVHVSTFLDLHDVGDALVRAGFEAPVLDVERYTLTYATLEALARDLKAIGATNAAVGRSRGLFGPRRWTRVRDAYEALRAEGVLPASYEVIHAHAWRGAARARPAREEAPLRFVPPRRRGGP
jgi:malonyl-CoA O-methyltransferase